MENNTIYKYKGKGVFDPAINLRDYLLKKIAEAGPITRTELTNLTGIPRTTIYDAVVKLILDERIRKYSVLSKKRGRPRIFYEIVPSSK